MSEMPDRAASQLQNVARSACLIAGTSVRSARLMPGSGWIQESDAGFESFLYSGKRFVENNCSLAAGPDRFLLL